MKMGPDMAAHVSQLLERWRLRRSQFEASAGRRQGESISTDNPGMVVYTCLLAMWEA
jgi:hypothetical protein